MFSMWMPALHRLDCVADFEDPAGGLFWVGVGGRWRILCGCVAFLVDTARNDPGRVVKAMAAAPSWPCPMARASTRHVPHRSSGLNGLDHACDCAS
jgi:hypothetical protein